MRTQVKRAENSKRRNFIFSERMEQRLADLAQRTDASSDTEVIKDALLTYSALVSWLESGAVFYVKDSSGTLSPIDLLIDVKTVSSRPKLTAIEGSKEDGGKDDEAA